MESETTVSNQKVELRALISRCLKGWYWFILFGGALISGTWLYLKSKTPLYEVTSKILIQEDRKSEIGGASVFGESSSLFTPQFSLINEIEILKSSRLLEKVVESLSLNIAYFGSGKFVDPEFYNEAPITVQFSNSGTNFYGALFEVSSLGKDDFEVLISNFSLSENAVATTDTLQGKFGEEVEYRGNGFSLIKNLDYNEGLKIYINDPKVTARSYSMKLRIEPIPRSEVLNIGLTENITSRSITFIYSLIDFYNKEVLENKNRSTNLTLEFIDERLKIISKELYTVENELEDYKRDNNVPLELSVSAQEILNKASINDSQIMELKLQQSLLLGIKRELGKNENVLAVNYTINGQTPLQVEEYNLLIQQRNRLLLAATPNNPQVRALDAEMIRVKNTLSGWIDSKEKEYKSQIDFLLNQSIPNSKQIDLIPKYEREMLQIMRQQVIKETLFTFLLQRREETALTIASEVSNARIIDDPFILGLVSPDRKRVYLLGVIFSFGIPLLGFFLKEYFDDKIYSRDDISKRTLTPIIGEVADAGKVKDFRVKKGGRSIIDESFKLLRTNLKFFAEETEHRSILVTSSTSGEGKTFISINLATTLALSGNKVVVVGLDLRKPKLSEYLVGKRIDVGVTNYLIGQSNSIEELINPIDGVEGLCFIASGPIPPNPNELLMNEQMHVLMSELKSKFDYVILDTPPVGLVADALVIKDFVDLSIYVVKFASTETVQLGIVDDLYRNDKLKNPSVLLNGVKKRIGHKYGGYGYGYGYYDEDNRSRLKKLFSRKR